MLFTAKYPLVVDLGLLLASCSRSYNKVVVELCFTINDMWKQFVVHCFFLVPTLYRADSKYENTEFTVRRFLRTQSQIVFSKGMTSHHGSERFLWLKGCPK